MRSEDVYKKVAELKSVDSFFTQRYEDQDVKGYRQSFDGGIALV